jgi:5-methylcytosine-specific restriction endonuclease McrA
MRKRSEALVLLEAPACERCERRQPGAFHHLVPRSRGGKTIPGNLAWLCVECHRWVHDHPKKAAEHGWLRREASQALGCWRCGHRPEGCYVCQFVAKALEAEASASVK